MSYTDRILFKLISFCSLKNNFMLGMELCHKYLHLLTSPFASRNLFSHNYLALCEH